MGSKNFSIFVGLLFILWKPSVFAQIYDFSGLRQVNNTVGASLQYNFNKTYDFNNDGINDTVNCSSTTFIDIIDGKTKTSLFTWAGPLKYRVASNGYIHRRVLSNCEIFQFDNNRPMVIIGNYWNTFTPRDVPYWRANAPQYVVFFNGQRFVVRDLNITGLGQYIGVARSIKCGPYPQALFNQYGPGALCFFSNYAAASTDYSALIKVEYDAPKTGLVINDITASSGLHWKYGSFGTSIWSFPVGSGFASNQRDGAFNMDSAFFDFNGDNKIDFLTVGQHAKIRAHTMVFDNSKPEGIRFVTTNLTSANKYTDRTELLRATPLNRLTPQVDSNCAYLSGENEGRNERDQIYCYDSSGWQKINMPLNFNSEYFNARMQILNNDLVIKTRRIPRDGSLPVDLTFLLPFL